MHLFHTTKKKKKYAFDYTHLKRKKKRLYGGDVKRGLCLFLFLTVKVEHTQHIVRQANISTPDVFQRKVKYKTRPVVEKRFFFLLETARRFICLNFASMSSYISTRILFSLYFQYTTLLKYIEGNPVKKFRYVNL